MLKKELIISKTKGFFCFSFNKRSPKDAAWKTEFFCVCYFSEKKRKSTKTITEQCLSCQNKSVCQKLAWSCKKWKLAQKAIYTLFAQNHSIFVIIWCMFSFLFTGPEPTAWPAKICLQIMSLAASNILLMHNCNYALVWKMEDCFLWAASYLMQICNF